MSKLSSQDGQLLRPRREAAIGGPIGLLQDGDIIEIDAGPEVLT